MDPKRYHAAPKFWIWLPGTSFQFDQVPGMIGANLQEILLMYILDNIHI